MKKVLLIGATGTIGKAITAELASDCNVIKVGSSSGDVHVDIADSESIAALYKQHADADAVICAAARGVVFAPVAELTRADCEASLQSKQLGQIDVVLQGLKMLGDHVSFTLTTGILNGDPILQGAAAAMVNAAVEGFTIGAAIDMPGKQRINVVSPALLTESLEKYRNFFPGHQTVAAAAVALAYRKCVMGGLNGEVVRVGW